MAVAEVPAKKSDLGVRAASAVVMVTVAGTALWLGGTVFFAFALLIGAGVLWEWSRLALAFTAGLTARLAWLLGGIVYIGLAVWFIAMLGSVQDDVAGWLRLVLSAMVAGVVCTDIGAYFAGRAIGGPKIAPRISPSKTWAGLGGGIVGASLAMFGLFKLSVALIEQRDSHGAMLLSDPLHTTGQMLVAAAVIGSLIAIVAQAGDFFESWMKRRAGVKDSGKLIPGHGGLFDRLDGLLAVSFVTCILAFAGLHFAA